MFRCEEKRLSYLMNTYAAYNNASKVSSFSRYQGAHCTAMSPDALVCHTVLTFHRDFDYSCVTNVYKTLISQDCAGRNYMGLLSTHWNALVIFPGLWVTEIHSWSSGKSQGSHTRLVQTVHQNRNTVLCVHCAFASANFMATFEWTYWAKRILLRAIYSQQQSCKVYMCYFWAG